MMITTQPSHATTSQDSVTIRALSSITPQHAETIAQAVHASGRAWDIQTFDDYDGYLSIFVEPSVRGDKQKSFFISGTAQHLELFETQDDSMVALASFSDVEAISARLLELIAQQQCWQIRQHAHEDRPLERLAQNPPCKARPVELSFHALPDGAVGFVNCAGRSSSPLHSATSPSSRTV